MDNELKERIESQVTSQPVFLYMKGTPAQPMCGFSAGVIGALNNLGLSYGTFNIFDDETIRQGIKEYANWPTIPQLYINGEFVGGHDIIVEMAKSGELEKKINSK